jgi:DNA-binding MarR family transcriptional regulator
VTSLDDVVPFRIHRTNRLLRTHLQRFLEAHADGLTPEQWFIVQRLAERAPRRQVEFAEPVLGDPPNVTRLVDALVERNVVQRAQDRDDRRSWLVSLTPAGKELVARTRKPVVAARADLTDGIGEREIRTLLATLDRIDANTRRLLARD